MPAAGDKGLGGDGQAVDVHRSCQRSRTREPRLGQGPLYRHAACYPLIKRACFHHDLAFVGQFNGYHLRQVLPAEQDTDGNSAEMTTAPGGQHLLR